MKWKTLIAAALAAAFAAPFGVLSADADKIARSAPPSTALFDRLDKNKDGFVTRDEARDATELQGRFAELDKNNDGKISRSEIRALDAERSAAGGSKARK